MNLRFYFLEFCLLKVLFFFFLLFFSLFSIFQKILNLACDPDLNSYRTATDLYVNIS